MTSPAEFNSEISEIHFEIHMIYRYQELTFNLVDIGFRYQTDDQQYNVTAQHEGLRLKKSISVYSTVHHWVYSDITLLLCSVFYGIHSDVNKPFRTDND